MALDSANPEAQFNLGTLLLRRGEAVPAALQFENTVLVRPDYVPAYNNLAKAYFLAGLPELALAAYEEALRRDPSNAIALKNRQRLAAAGDNQLPSGRGWGAAGRDPGARHSCPAGGDLPKTRRLTPSAS